LSLSGWIIPSFVQFVFGETIVRGRSWIRVGINIERGFKRVLYNKIYFLQKLN
jgi:hypothetical protein